MPVSQSTTRQELRRSVGYGLGGLFVSTASTIGTTTTLVDEQLEASDDYLNGHWIVLPGQSGTVRRVDDYVGSSTTVTLRSAATTAIASGDAYELYDEDIPPARIHDFINQAIRDMTLKQAVPSTSLASHTGGMIYTFTLPTTMVKVGKVEYRAAYTGESILTCDAVWDELTDATVTASLDTQLFREGSGAVKLVSTGPVATTILASDSIASTDYSRYTHIEFWIRSSVALTAGQLSLRLSSTANAGTTTEELAVPATSADTSTFHRVALANPESDTAIISVGLIDTSGIGAATVWLDGIEATESGSEDWKTIHRLFWDIDKANRALVLNKGEAPSYALLRISGWVVPAELSDDTTAIQVDPTFVVNKALAFALEALGNRHGSRPGAGPDAAGVKHQLAERARARAQHPGQGVWLD